MQLATVLGQVVSTVKDPGLGHLPLLLLQALDGATGTPVAAGSSFVASDPVGAGVGEVVLVATGSAARAALGLERSPVDAAVVGIADTVIAGGERTYSKAG